MNFTRVLKIKDFNGDFNNLNEMEKFALFQLVGQLEKDKYSLSIFDGEERVCYHSKFNSRSFFIAMRFFSNFQNKFRLNDKKTSTCFAKVANMILEMNSFPTVDNLIILVVDRTSVISNKKVLP